MIRSVSLFVIVATAALLGCSESSNRNGDPTLGTPAFQKGLSQSDQAEFLTTMEQLESITSVYQNFDLQLIAKVTQDIRTYAYQNGTAAVADQTPANDYLQVLSQYLRGCKAYTRTNSSSSNSVKEVVGWMDQLLDAADTCKTQATWSQRNSSSSMTKWERISINGQGLSVSFAENDGSFRPRDIVGATAAASTKNISKTAPNKYDGENIQKMNYTFSGSLVLADGRQPKVEAIDVTESRSIEIDDSTTRGTTTRLLKLVFDGTTNPVVYERSEFTAVNGRKTIKVTLNGDIIYEKK